MISIVRAQKAGFYATLSAYEAAVALEKECHEHMKRTVPRYNADRWAFVEKNTKDGTAAFYTDKRVEPVLPKLVADTQVEKLTDSGFKSVADEFARNPIPWVPNPPPVEDPNRPEIHPHPKPIPIVVDSIDPNNGTLFRK